MPSSRYILYGAHKQLFKDLSPDQVDEHKQQLANQVLYNFEDFQQRTQSYQSMTFTRNQLRKHIINQPEFKYELASSLPKALEN